MAKTKQREMITPEEYQSTLEQLKLRAIEMDSLKASCDREAMEDTNVRLSIATASSDLRSEGQYTVFVSYKVRGVVDEKQVLDIEAKYRVFFDTPTPVPDGFFDVYREINLKLTTLPYFRELVASTAGRMNIPTLTLPYNIFTPANELPDDSSKQRRLGSAKQLDEPKAQAEKPRGRSTARRKLTGSK